MQSILKALEAAERKPSKPALPEDTQQACIDLPGEDVHCYIYKPKLQIMLRKHRDVIFEIALFKGMTYTVEADQSDFYNARDKKLVEFKKKHKVSFTDGERMHLWVARGFKGHLILKANGKVLGRYEPRALDNKWYDEEPTTKPAPLIFVMKNEPVATPSAKLAAAMAHDRLPPDALAPWTPPQSPFELAISKTAAEQDQSMHVVEVKPGADTPQSVADFFKQGGEQTAVDTTGILTRNWLWAQITGSSAYFSDNKQWIKELWKEKFYLQRIVHKSGPKWYIVLKGNTGLREYLTAARYGTNHAKVIAITAGAGAASGLRHAAWEAARGSVKKAGFLALVFTITLDTAEWLADYEQRDPATGKPRKDLFDLMFKIGLDVAKAGISAAIGSLLIAAVLIVAAVIAPTVALPAALIVVGAVVFAIGTGYGLDWLDKKTGATDKLNELIRKSAEHLENKMPNDYSGYEKSIETALQSGLGA